jgi:hypothetical protein
VELIVAWGEFAHNVVDPRDGAGEAEAPGLVDVCVAYIAQPSMPAVRQAQTATKPRAPFVCCSFKILCGDCSAGPPALLGHQFPQIFFLFIL